MGLSLQGASGRSVLVMGEKLCLKELIVSDERLSESNSVARLRSVSINYFCVISNLHVVAVLIN